MTAAARGPWPPPPAVPPGSGHAGAELLLSYLRAELPEGDADRLREHLTGCPDCTEMLLDLAAFERGAPPAEDGAEREASWRRLAAARPWEPAAAGGDAEEPAAGPEDEPPKPPAGPPPRRRRRWLPWLRSLLGPRLHPATAVLLAASLAAAAGLGLRTIQLERRLAEPRPDQPLVDLHANRVTRGAGGEDEPWPVPPGASFTAVITPDVEEPFPRYEAEIVAPDDEILWTGRLTPDEDVGYVTLGLSRRKLSGSRYTIRLWGIDGERRSPAGTFRLEFAPEPADRPPGE